MLWFDERTRWIRRSRKTEIELTFQVSAPLSKSRWKVSVPELASWQRAHAGPPPGDISLRYPFFSASVPEGWLAKPTSCLAWQTASTLSTANAVFLRRTESGLFHDVFSMVWNPRRNIGFYPIIREDRPCSVKMKKGYNAACMFCILREYHTAGIVFPSLKMCVIWFIKRVARL